LESYKYLETTKQSTAYADQAVTDQRSVPQDYYQYVIKIPTSDLSYHKALLNQFRQNVAKWQFCKVFIFLVDLIWCSNYLFL
jgi:hypothetical protein